MRIPRIAFASMFLVITGLLATLLVVKVRAHSDGTVVLLTTSGPSGRLMDYPLSTVDPKQASYFWQGKAGTQGLVYKVSLLSREGDRVKLLIHARTCSEEDDLSSFTRDSDPAAKVWEVWFEPGEPLKLDVPGLGTLTLTGEWLDHMPNLLEMLHIDHLFPGPNELRFARPLLLKDNKVVGDFASVIGGFYNQDDKDRSAAFYVPGEGRFLISQLPMKSAVEAQVAMGRISFKEGGHSWEFVSGVPVHSADHLWVLHQPSYKPPTIAHSGDRVSFGNPKLVQTEPGVWTPETTPN